MSQPKDKDYNHAVALPRINHGIIKASDPLKQENATNKPLCEQRGLSGITQLQTHSCRQTTN